MICLSRSDLKFERSDKSKETRTNYNKIFPVKNGKINCSDDGEYDLSELCNYDYILYTVFQYCTLATGQRIELNPQ